jgi:hypothetical protein
MTQQPENKDKAEPKISKDELSEKELEKASGGRGKGPDISQIPIIKQTDVASP